MSLLEVFWTTRTAAALLFLGVVFCFFPPSNCVVVVLAQNFTYGVYADADCSTPLGDTDGGGLLSLSSSICNTWNDSRSVDDVEEEQQTTSLQVISCSSKCICFAHSSSSSSSSNDSTTTTCTEDLQYSNSIKESCMDQCMMDHKAVIPFPPRGYKFPTLPAAECCRLLVRTFFSVLR
jgi:hypothetical protein